MTREISNKGMFKLKGKKLLFWRFGPMSGQVQKNRKKRPTPVRKGIWVFPYPFFDAFFVWHQLNRYYPKHIRTESAKLLGLEAVKPPDFSNMDDDGNEIKKLTPEEEAELEKAAAEYWDNREKIEKEYQDKFFKIKKIWWGGEIYSRIRPNPQAQELEGGWFYYEKPIDFLAAVRKNMISHDQWGTWSLCGYQGVGKGSWGNLSRDSLECFIPTT